MVQHSHPHLTTGKPIALTIRTFVSKVMYLLFNTLSRFVIAFLPRSKRFLISWVHSPSTVIGVQKNSLTLLPFFPHLFAMKWWDWIPRSSLFECWVLSQLFHSFFHFRQEAFEFLFTFCHKGGVICITEVIDISPSNLDSSLCLIQPGMSHDVLGIEVK